jgi:protein involved in polysaccharide export with SLBB domain
MLRVLTICIGACFLVCQAVVWCETAEETPGESNSGSESSEPALPPDKYEVSAQDLLNVRVVGEMDLTGDFRVSNDGTIKYPYLEYISVEGETVRQVEKEMTDLLKDGWLIDPQVIVTVKEYSQKFVYVMGEGITGSRQISFSGQNEMTLLRAIAMAGGFNRIAKKSQVFIFRTGENRETARLEVDAKDIIKGKAPDILIKTNDTIYVGERFW